MRCAHCGVHLPRGEARQAGGRLYCSEEHARLGAGAALMQAPLRYPELFLAPAGAHAASRSGSRCATSTCTASRWRRSSSRCRWSTSDALNLGSHALELFRYTLRGLSCCGGACSTAVLRNVRELFNAAALAARLRSTSSRSRCSCTRAAACAAAWA